jgi:hypothetical protein
MGLIGLVDDLLVGDAAAAAGRQEPEAEQYKQ